MRVLFDIVHPADVLFFRKPIAMMQERGDEIQIISRKKDVACDLLDQFELRHVPVSTAGNGRIGLARELIVRDWQMLKSARRFAPQVMLGFGGVSISHVGKLLGIPSVSFYAADTATLQTRITWPFISHLYVPQAYAGEVPANRTSRFPGIKELSYFHPENFEVNDDIARANGWDDKVDNFFIRTVSWRANHDLGKTGWSDDTLGAMIQKLEKRGRVHISSERDLAPEFERYRYTGAKNQLHHVMAKCKLYVGESATMAHEACLLGVPSIYDGSDHPGTTKELNREGLLIMLRQPGPEVLMQSIDRLLEPQVQQDVDAKRRAYLAARPNLAQYIVDAADRHALGNGVQ